MAEWLIPDTEFDDPSAWEIVGFGGSVTGGLLKFTLATVIRAAPLPLVPSSPGKVYYYEMSVPSVTAFGFTGRALWGGVEFWNKNVQGAGAFSGLITAENTAGLVFQANPAQYSVDYIRIREATVADIVNVHISDVLSRLGAISSIKNKTVSLYTPDQIIKTTDKLDFPAVGVIYAGMRGIEDSSRTGQKGRLMVDIFVAGAELCKDDTQINDLKPGVTAILQDIRNAMTCTTAPGNHKWTFMAEFPEQLSEKEVIGYVQRWQAVTSIVS